MNDNSGRFILTFPKQQMDMLKRLSYIDDKSMAEIVRTAVKQYVQNRKDTLDEEDLVKEFWTKVEQTKEGCWEWQGYIDPAGYGRNARELFGEKSAHRISYVISKGQIKEGMYVCHACDNPKCVNPLHLFEGTAMDNTQDMISKGRYRQKKERLTGDAVAKIIELYYGGHRIRVKQLSEMFNVNQGTISNILTRKSHMDKPEVMEAWGKVDRKEYAPYKHIKIETVNDPNNVRKQLHNRYEGGKIE